MQYAHARKYAISNASAIDCRPCLAWASRVFSISMLSVVCEPSFLPFFRSNGGVKREMTSNLQHKQELTSRQAILKLTGVSHYVVQFECICVVSSKLILDFPEPSVGDECQVEWSDKEYMAKVLVEGDDQQARKAEAELLKGLSQDYESDDKPPAKKPRLLKCLTKKTAVSKPKNKFRQKKVPTQGEKV